MSYQDPCWPHGVGSHLPHWYILSICVWFVAPDMVDLLWVSAEVKRESVVREKYNLS